MFEELKNAQIGPEHNVKIPVGSDIIGHHWEQNPIGGICVDAGATGIHSADVWYHCSECEAQGVLFILPVGLVSFKNDSLYYIFKPSFGSDMTCHEVKLFMMLK